MRLFVGIPLAPVLLEELQVAVGCLRSPGDGLRWTPPATWHITLQFLGEAQQCDPLLVSLSAIRQPPVPIALENLGCFERVGVLFAGVRVSAELLALQQSVVAATRSCGFVAESRAYQPHITLARSRESRPKSHPELSRVINRLHEQPRFTGYTAREFLLYESFLGPGGSRYEVRGRFPLK